MGNLTLGIDIGGTNFRLGAVDEEGNISHFEKIQAEFLMRAMLWR